MPTPDDPLTASPAEFPDDMQTIAVAKPVAAAPSEVAVMGANPDSAVPFVFGKRIAKGGMGAILEGEDCKLGRTIAVKVMLDANASEDQARRFVQEAAVLGKLAHPNIVPVYDLGRDSEGALYYTMKLVKGRTLQDILDDLRREKKEALEHYTLDRLLTIFRKVCDALAFAHASNIIHRDLKPENVMVGEFGEVLVMDWGIAKVLNELGIEEPLPAVTPQSMSGTGSLTATMDGAVMGTPNYMSPEQAMGKVNELDERSDIFSLGGILYAILTLRPPVEGKDVWEVLEKVQMANITEPTRFGATTGKGTAKAKGDVLEAKKITPLPHMPGGRVPNALSAVAMKALTLDKTKRYQNIAAFSADIEAYQGGFATSAENAGAWTQVKLLIKRNKGIFTTAAAAWLLITTLGVWFMFNLHSKEQRALAGEQSAKAALVKSALNLAEAARREGNGREMQAALAEVPEDLRDSTYGYLLEQSDSSFARIRSAGGQIESVAAHPRRPGVFAIADSSGKVILMEVHTGAHLLEFTPDFPPKSGRGLKLAFSPDGERVAVGQEWTKRIIIHSARDGKKLLAWEAPGTRRFEFSPDGRLLLQTEWEEKLLTVWDAATGQPKWKYEPEGTWTFGTFTPDGQQVVTHGNKDHVRLVKAQDGTLVRPLSNDPVNTFAVRPDGKMIVTGGRIDGTIRGVLLADGKVVFEFRAHERGGIQHLSFTPDGARFVSVAVLPDGRQAIQLWDANTGAPLQSLLGGSGNITSAGAHPLSGELLVAGQNSRAWNLTGTSAKWTLQGGDDSSIAFWGSEDVVFAAAPGHNAALQKLQADTSELLWKPLNGRYRRASVSADGRFAAIGYIYGSGAETHDVFLLRNPGTQTEQTTVFKEPVGLILLRLSSTGDHLATIGQFNQSLALYDSATGQQLVKLEREKMKKFWDLGWLSGGKQLVGLVTAKAERGNAGSEEWIVLWDAATGKIVQTAPHRTAMDVLAIAPDGRRFAEAGADKKVRIRDAATLAVQQEFRAHDGPITALAWHPTKPIVATASADLSVKLWNLETGRRLEEFRGMVNAPDQLAFSPSGQRLGCAGNGNPTRIWEPPSLNDHPAAE